jgi:hypothetical protein
MRVISGKLSEAVGRVTLDSAMLALFLHSREQAIAEMQIELSADDVNGLQEYVDIITSGSTGAQEILSTVLRSADRTIQR